MSAAFVTSTGIGKLWAQTQTSSLPGGVGSSSCAAVQQSVQLWFETRFDTGYIPSVAIDPETTVIVEVHSTTCGESSQVSYSLGYAFY